MTNFMKTFKGETYWAASDIGWVTWTKPGKTLAYMPIIHRIIQSYIIFIPIPPAFLKRSNLAAAIMLPFNRGSWTFLHRVWPIGSRMCNRDPGNKVCEVWMDSCDAVPVRYFMKGSPLARTPVDQ